MEKGMCCIGLDHPKSSCNAGAVLRAAGCFGVDMLALSGRRYDKSPTDVDKVVRRLPLLRVDDLHQVVPFDCVPVAVDLVDGAVPLFDYEHPARAFYVFGAEDATLGRRVLDWCRDRVMVPTAGCLNLAACVNVVLYDRALKRELASHVCSEHNRLCEGHDHAFCRADSDSGFSCTRHEGHSGPHVACAYNEHNLVIWK